MPAFPKTENFFCIFALYVIKYISYYSGACNGAVFSESAMIEVTKINGVKILINPDLLELVEETPDTVLTFTTGRKIIVKESRQEVKNLVKSYRKDIFAD